MVELVDTPVTIIKRYLMLDKIIKVEPTDKYFSITWMTGKRCNYDCMYCPSEIHDNVSICHDLETMQTAWHNIYSKTKHLGLKYKIGFTGGEPTVNKNFLPFITWLRSNYKDNIAMLLVTSNGSAGLNYYKRLAGLVEAITFSTHSEYMNEQVFFNKVKTLDKIMVRPVKSFHVNIMNEYWNQDRILLYKKLLDQHNISHSVNEIKYSRQTRTFVINKGKQNLDNI